MPEYEVYFTRRLVREQSVTVTLKARNQEAAQEKADGLATEMSTAFFCGQPAKLDKLIKDQDLEWDTDDENIEDAEAADVDEVEE